MMRYLYGHPTAQAITIGPGDFDPPDYDDFDDFDEEPTEKVYRLDRVVQRQGIAVARYTVVYVDPKTHEIQRYAYRHWSVVRWLGVWTDWELGGPGFHRAAEWCRKRARKRSNRMPRVWARLVEMAAKHGVELKP